MPVDYPAGPPAAVRRIPSRTLIVAASFLVTLAALFALSPLLRVQQLSHLSSGLDLRDRS